MSFRNDDNTIGVVHWEGMWAAGDGEQISLIIPAFFLSQHTPYLNDILKSRFEALFDVDIPFRLDPGHLTESTSDVRYDPGQIVITGVREPWPDGEQLRDVLEGAFAEAGAVEAEQTRRADDLVKHLRKTGQR